MRIDRADFWQTRFYILHQFCIFSIVRPRKPSRQSMQSLPKYIATTLRWSFSSECPMCHIVIWSVPDFLTYLFDNKNLWRCLLPHLVNWTSWWRTMKRWQSPIFFPSPLTFGVFRWSYWVPPLITCSRCAACNIDMFCKQRWKSTMPMGRRSEALSK